jgi:hypothetical protein
VEYVRVKVRFMVRVRDEVSDRDRVIMWDWLGR